MIEPLVKHPAIRGDRLVFVSEDDLWMTDPDGGLARRLTNGTGRMSTPRISRDGRQIAVSGTELGTRDLYTLDIDGGPLTRRTWLGAQIRVCGYDPLDQIVFASNAAQWFSRNHQLYRIGSKHGNPVPLWLGPAVSIAWGPDGERLLGRHSTDLARWRRYRGGRIGRLWFDSGAGDFTLLPDFGGDTTDPMLAQGRVYFLSDTTGEANLHSCLPDGTDLAQHTHHHGFAARSAHCDGRSIVYTLGGDLWLYELDSATSRKLVLRTHSQRTRTQPRFPSARPHLQSYALHPQGHSIALCVRGKPFVGGLWEGPLLQLGAPQGVHHRLASFLADGERMVWASDAGGEEHLELYDLSTRTIRVLPAAIGRARHISVGPGELIAVTNHAAELHLVDLLTDQVVRLDHSHTGRITGASFSPDGRWLSWSCPTSTGKLSRIRLASVHDLDAIEITDLTPGDFHDHSPDFDPLGRFLYFLSDRELDPHHDSVRFDYGFPKGSRPYLIPLDAQSPSPFRPAPRGLGKSKPPKAPERLHIDLDGIAARVVRFPISDGIYTAIRGLPSGRVLLSRSPLVSATLKRWNRAGPPTAFGSLLLWDFDRYELSTVHSKLTSFTLDHPRATVAIRSGNDLRVFPADPDKGVRTELKKLAPRPTTRKGRWIDLARVRLTVDPPSEWAQMLDESWRLMRDHFWVEDMGAADWDQVREQYRALVPRVSVRSELSDLIWCMHGELGTSHAYEIGGEYRGEAVRRIGRLGADCSWDGEAWVIDRIHTGDPGHPTRSSPLSVPGVNARPGTRIHSVNGVGVSESPPLGALLVGYANRPVILELSEPNQPIRAVEVYPSADDAGARYRTWVNTNRTRVHEATHGRAGYLHIPNMGPTGFADFHRDFLSESAHDALLVDVRFNTGGHISQLLLGQLMQRRLAYTTSRHFRPTPYPRASVLGPMVCLTNELAGSDGDIFSAHWKALGLGPLVGTRTWGGIIGISPQNRLVDGTLTTQPEYANWFGDGSGYGVENRGVDPDIEVPITPMDHAAGRDPQLSRGIELLWEAIERDRPELPRFEQVER